MLVEKGDYSEAWCETCDWRVTDRDYSKVRDEAEAHEHPTLGQDVSLWTAKPDPVDESNAVLSAVVAREDVVVFA